MNARLKISLLLNFSLAAGLIWMFLRGSGQAPSPAHVTQMAQSNETAPPLSAPPTGAAADAPSFRWSQLESTDYRTYIKNLRAIGCPEQTLRDIVTADVDSLYRERRAQLEKKLADASVSAAPGSRAAWEAELRRLPGEESAVLAELLGLPSAPAALAGEDPPAATTGPIHPHEEKPITMPLVFANVDPAALNLDPSRIQAINSLQQRFMNELGGPGQDPNDPAYLARWQKAQPEIDSLLRGFIGVNAWQQYDLAARRSRAAGAQ